MMNEFPVWNSETYTTTMMRYEVWLWAW